MGDGQHRQRRPDTQPEEGLSRYLDSIPFPFQTSLRSHFYQMPLFRPFKTSLLTFSYFRIAFVVLLFYCTFVLFAKWAKKAKRKKKNMKKRRKKYACANCYAFYIVSLLFWDLIDRCYEIDLDFFFFFSFAFFVCLFY